MLSTTLKAVLIIITLIYLYIIVDAVKKRKLQTSFSIFWILTGIVLIVSILIPNFIESVSSFLGFEKASNMIFCLAIFIAFYLIFNLVMLLSKEFKQNVILIQEVSMLKKRIEKLENEKLLKK